MVHATKPGAMLITFGLAVPPMRQRHKRPPRLPETGCASMVCERTAGASCRRLAGSFVSWTPDRIVLRDSPGV